MARSLPTDPEQVRDDGSDAHLALLRGDGVIDVVNAAWVRFAVENGGDPDHVGAGTDYLSVCANAHGSDGRDGQRVALAIRSALAGRTERVAAVYPCHGPGERRWFEVRVHALEHGPGALVAHLPVPEQHLLTELRDALALLGGALPDGVVLEELAAGLGADSHVLRDALPRLGVLRDCLDHPPLRQPVDLADVVTAATATLRPAPRVEVVAPTTPPDGDARVLTALLRELLRNVAEHGGGSAIVRVAAEGSELLRVVVDDQGPGVPVEQREAVVQPDPGVEQLGIGLPIARALAHHLGGWLLVTATPEGGCRVRVEL